jgi:hypothetical protein
LRTPADGLKAEQKAAFIAVDDLQKVDGAFQVVQNPATKDQPHDGG